MAECGLLNLAVCLPEKFFQYIVGIINAPIKPLLSLTKNLLSEPINLHLFVNFWAIIIYMLSMFYGFLIIYSGFNFIISGYDSKKREEAKAWLRNILIMIILVQSSFFIYELAIELSSIMTTTTLSLIDYNFFLLTFDNIANMALELVFIILYFAVLLLTVLILIIRYAMVATGVLLFPLGIFFYFIAPLRPYGSFIINLLGILVFVTFLDAVILIGFSKLLSVGIFSNFKILVVIAGFLIIDTLMLFLMFFSVVKGALNIYRKFT